VASLSPEYTRSDLEAWDKGIGFSMRALWPQLYPINFHQATKFACPVVIFQGKHDLSTSAVLAERWFQTLRAPSKKFVWFENSAHMVFEEEPGKVLVHLVQDVLPLTQKVDKRGRNTVSPSPARPGRVMQQ